MARVMVDMSAVLLHHGHIRILKEASLLGTVVVALTSDQEIIKRKGIIPELAFEHRKEILMAIRYVDEVVSSNWLIDNDFLLEHNINLLIHGDDNSNVVSPNKLRTIPRTTGVSTSDIRQRVLENLKRSLSNASSGR